MLLRGSRLPDLNRDGAPARILVIQLRRIGDALLGTPALRALATRFPQATIDFMAEPPTDEVLWGHPLIDRLLVAPTPGSNERWLKFVRQLRARRYDWVIDFFSNPRSAQFAFLTGARIRVGLDRFGRRWAYTHRVVEEPVDVNTYAADLRLQILAHLGVPSAGRALEIYADRADPGESSRAAELLAAIPPNQPLVAVATGSANPAKRYPADLTARMIDELRQRHRTVILTSGPGETALAEEILQHQSFPVPHLADARVPTLAALYRQCDLYIGPDSSPKHVAVACGLPTVTIFGPGNPLNWNDPQSARNIVLIAPCDTRPHCIESECSLKGCIRKISVADILSASDKLLQSSTVKRSTLK
jgi:ADP-heptose:LPS heptosyltransferase